MSMSGYFPLQFQLRPSELLSGLDIPCPLLEGQLRLQDDRILCPTDSHGLGQYLRGILVGTVKLPHPTQISRGEAGDVRVRTTQILRRSDSGAFLWPAVDQSANLAVKFYLRQVCRHQDVQRREHGAVVYGFSDVHPNSSFPARTRLFFYPLSFQIANEQALGFIFRGLAP